MAFKKKALPKVVKTDKKTGKITWEPSDLLKVRDMEPGFRYRWARNDPAELLKLESEGFEIVSEVNSSVEHENPEGVDDNHKLSTVTEYREVILLRIPEEVAKARQEYFERQSFELITASKKEAQSKVDELFTENSENPAHRPLVRGTITIS